ncbi:MAG TPA: hypothetical protein VFV50_12005, partial [Bdellovibrionales bacterium]|nr:hypothetical protein [Bdellovibrionales bacterium]
GFERFFVPRANEKHVANLEPRLLKKVVWVRQVGDLLGLLKVPPKQNKKSFKPQPKPDPELDF